MWTHSLSKLFFILGLMAVLPGLALLPGAAWAALEIDITKGNVDPLPVAIPDFHGAEPAALDQGKRMAAVITANLNRSGLFRALDPKSFIQTSESLQTRPRFADWRVLNAQALVSGKVGVESEIPRTDEHVWLAPREVDSARVQTSGEQPQTEQYLFYRGVAQLRSPIRVVTEDNGKRLDLWNQPQPGTKGEQPINDLWLADIRPDGKVAFRTIDSVVIESASAKALTRTAGSFEEGEYDTANLAQLRTSMHEAIMSAGLFEDEATAMLNTWELSYFKSAGMRLFFILPDAWTDYQLPLKISEPADITRVMIGRVELITQQQHELLSAIAAGPASTPSWLTERLDKVPPELRTSLWQDLQTGARKLSTLEDFEVPADYKAYINLGRFRDAIVLSGARDNGALAQFAKNYRIALN